MVICESLYSPLQLFEVGLRNAIHNRLKCLFGDNWYENSNFKLTDWGTDEVDKAKAFYDILKPLAVKYDFEYPKDKLLILANDVKKVVDDKAKFAD